MNRTGNPSVEVLLARIAALEAENRQLTERVVKLEEERIPPLRAALFDERDRCRS
ncbi:hypothetical protein [Bradyrhizobium sp. USDA 4529]